MFKRLVTDYEALLTFVVAGGGFAGVETIGSINDFFKAPPWSLSRSGLPRYRGFADARLPP
jgi:NADH dehydrogenase FAD-containing subunit